MDFVALDFETANPNFSSVCQVGLVEFNAGLEGQKFSSLVDPEDYFNELNMSIHGIGPEDVKGAPNFRKIYPHLSKYLFGKTVVSHTPFDRSVLRQAILKYQLPDIDCQWLDSARVVRRVWLDRTQEGYGLASIAFKLGIQLRHHDALEDARAAGMILLHAIAESGICLEDWIARSHFPIGSDTRVLTREGNPDGPLFGENLVFTGSLVVLRREAADIAAQVGCTVSNSITKKTSILVVGDQDITRLSSGQTKSLNHRKAESLIRQGFPIRIIGESDFLTMCQSEIHRDVQLC